MGCPKDGEWAANGPRGAVGWTQTGVAEEKKRENVAVERHELRHLLTGSWRLGRLGALLRLQFQLLLGFLLLHLLVDLKGGRQRKTTQRETEGRPL